MLKKFALLLVLLVGACTTTLDPEATQQNLRNVTTLAGENAALHVAAKSDPSVAAASKELGTSAVRLAEAMAGTVR